MQWTDVVSSDPCYIIWSGVFSMTSAVTVWSCSRLLHCVLLLQPHDMQTGTPASRTGSGAAPAICNPAGASHQVSYITFRKTKLVFYLKSIFPCLFFLKTFVETFHGLLFSVYAPSWSLCHCQCRLTFSWSTMLHKHPSVLQHLDLLLRLQLLDSMQRTRRLQWNFQKGVLVITFLLQAIMQVDRQLLKQNWWEDLLARRSTLQATDTATRLATVQNMAHMPCWARKTTVSCPLNK